MTTSVDSTKLLSSMTKTLSKVSEKVSDLQDLDLHQEKGMSYLTVKSSLLLSYINFLNVFMLKKVRGEKIETPVYNKLHEIRSMIEQMKPLDKKLKF